MTKASMSMSVKTALRTGGRWLLSPVGLACVIAVGVTDILLGASVYSWLYEAGILGQRPVIYYSASNGFYFGASVVLFCLFLYFLAVVARVAVADWGQLSPRVFVEDWTRLLKAAGVSFVLLLAIGVGAIVFLLGGYLILRPLLPDFPAALVTLLLPYLWAAVIASSFIYSPFVVLDEEAGIGASLRRSWRLSAGSRLRTLWLGLLAFGVGALLALVVIIPILMLVSSGSELARSVVVAIPAELLIIYPIGVFGHAYHQLYERETDRSSPSAPRSIENV